MQVDLACCHRYEIIAVAHDTYSSESLEVWVLENAGIRFPNCETQ